MWWNIVMVIILFSLFIMQQVQIEKLRKYMEYHESKIEDLTEAALTLLRQSLLG